MADYLRIVQEIIAQHRLVRHDVGVLGGWLSDVEALFNLQKAHSSWSQSDIESMAGKQKDLGQVIGRVGDGLKRHFGYEEKSLPSMLGEILMKGLELQHQGIMGLFEKAGALAAETAPGEVGQEELLGRRARMQQAVAEICQSVEVHMANEEVLLKMLSQALSA